VTKTRKGADIIQDLHLLQDQKVVLKFLSVNNIVIAPAKTGNDNNNRKAVIKSTKRKEVIYEMVNFRSHVCNGTNEINGT
jgi:hypothetical protein